MVETWHRKYKKGTFLLLTPHFVWHSQLSVCWWKTDIHIHDFPSIIYGMKILAQNVQRIIVPNSGHWIPEERQFVIKQLANFFGSNGSTTTNTSK